MASPKIGQTKTVNGKQKVWSGQNYGYQTPATHNKLKEEGKFKHGTQALDRVASSASKFVKDKLPAVAKAAADYSKWSEEGARRVAARDAQTTVGKGINAVKAVTSAPTRAKDAAVQAVSDKTNVDSRIVRAGAEVVGAVIKTKAGQGIVKASGGRIAPPGSTPNRSVGAAARADVAGRTAPATRRLHTPKTDGVVRPPTSRTQATRASSSPGIAQNITKEQAAANASRTAARQPATPTSQRGRTVQSGGTVRTNTSTTARQAGGPIKPKTDGTDIARDNTVVKAAPSDRAKTRLLKEKAQAQYLQQEKTGNVPSVNRPKAGQDTRNYLPNNGRRSPTKPTIAQQRDAYKAKLVNERIPADVRGQARRTAERAIDKEVTKYGKDLEQKARDRVKAHQANQQAKAQKGTTESSRESMARDMAGRPKAPITKTRTKTTGTKRIPANPTTRGEFNSEQGDRLTRNGRGLQGRVITHKDGSKTTIRPKDASPTSARKSTGGTTDLPGGLNRAKTVDPKTGRPGLMSAQGTRSSAKPSSTRTKGSNPAENFSPSTRSRAPLSSDKDLLEALGKAKSNEEYTDIFKKLSPGERLKQSPGLGGRGQRTGGIRPVDGRGSSTPAHRTGTTTLRGGNGKKANPDTVLRGNARNKSDKLVKVEVKNGKVVESPPTKTSRGTPRDLLQAASPARVDRVVKDAAGRPKATPDTRKAASNTAKRQAIKESVRSSRTSRQATRGLTKEQRAKLQQEYNNRVYEDLKPTDRRGNLYQVTKGGEVRLQGTAKGDKYLTGTESGTTDGRVPKAGPHDGGPSRSVANKAQQSRERAGRSTEASKKAKETTDAVRQRLRNRRRAKEVLDNSKNKLRPGVKKTLKDAKPANTLRAKVSQLSKGVRNAVDRKGNDLNAVMRKSLRALQR